MNTSPDQATQQTQQTPVAAAPVTADVIAAAVQAGIQAHDSRVAATPKEMTPEEKAAYLQIFNPAEDGFVDSFVEAITSEEATPEARIKAIEHLRDGIANQSIRGAQLIAERVRQEILQELAPARDRALAEQGEQMWNQFAAKYPHLKDHRQLVDMVSVQLQSSGFTPTNLDEAFSRAAEASNEVLTRITGKPVVTSTATTPTANTMPRMSQTNTTPSAASAPAENEQPGVASFFLRRKR